MVTRRTYEKTRNFNVAEIHFSEPVKLGENVSITITDKNFENKEISENLLFEEMIMLEDNITGLMGFWQNKTQPNERFYVEFRGISDQFNNEISLQKYTIIDRINE